MSEQMAPARLAAVHPFEVNVGETYVTVRRGDRWSKYPTGTVVEMVIQDPGNRESYAIVGLGTIERRFTVLFQEIEARHIEMEHEASSRLYSGLLASMRRAYGKEFQQDELVTVVFYSVDELDEDTQDEFIMNHAFDLEDSDVAATAPTSLPPVYLPSREELLAREAEATAEAKAEEAAETADLEAQETEAEAEARAAQEALDAAAAINPTLPGQEEAAKALGHGIIGAAGENVKTMAEEFTASEKALESNKPLMGGFITTPSVPQQTPSEAKDAAAQAPVPPTKPDADIFGD